MQFNSIEFAVFFCVVYTLYLVLPFRWQNRMLLLASYVFYGAWDWRFLSLMLISTVLDYFCGLGMDGCENPRRRRLFLLASVTGNLGLLGFFKYFNFFSDSFARLVGLFGLEAHARTLNIVLPVGISFYTFQTMSYTIDVYWQQRDAVRSFLDFALYVSLFPQLVAGPIERASHLLPQVLAPRVVTLEKVSAGAVLIGYGLFQKVVVADNLAVIADRVFGGPVPANGLEALLGVYAFAVQIFCDFAGYSNIARGAAACMGFDLMVNFRAPYVATNPAEFWRRWHVSLSTWLRDYLYIPLGGNRRGRAITYRNLAITMLLGGLWHGAAWTFVAWGAYQGLLLIVHRLYVERVKPRPVPLSPWVGRAWIAVKWVFFFHLVCVGWVLFRSQSVAQIGGMLRAMFSLGTFALNPETLGFAAEIAVYSLPLIAVHLLEPKNDDPAGLLRWPLPARVVLYLVLFYGVVVLGADDAQTFIYFQF